MVAKTTAPRGLLGGEEKLRNMAQSEFSNCSKLDIGHAHYAQHGVEKSVQHAIMVEPEP